MPVETITWVDPDGAELELFDLAGITGRGLPPVAFNDMVVPLQPGSMFRSVRDMARQLIVPICVQGVSLIDYREQLRTLAGLLHPSTSPGTLRVATVDGLTRELTCWYLDGFGWLEEYPDWSIPSIAFRACDPYWYDASDTEIDFRSGTPATFFPIFPLRLSASEVFADATVNNAGDIDVWPVWEIHGPAASPIVLRNLTSDTILTLDLALTAGETVTVDTRRGAKTVLAGDGSNRFSDVDWAGGSSMWPLLTGSNSIRVEMAGATSDSLVALRYRHGYLVA